MAFCRFLLPLLILSVVQCYSVQVPVYLWGDLAKPSVKPSALSTVTVEDFDSIVKTELQSDPFTVIFIEETLSVEDFSLKNADGDTSYPYLHANIGNSLYLPSVDSPLSVLNKLADPEKVDHVKLTENGLSAEIEPESGKYLFINLNDAREGESRSDLLHRHNDFMEDMFAKLHEQYGKVVALYTAHYPSWTVTEAHSRVRRQAEAVPDNMYEGLRLHLETVYLNDGINEQALTGLTGGTTSLNNTEMNTTLSYDGNRVTLNFVSKAGYWFLNTVTLSSGTVTEDLHATTEVYSQLGFSYACGQNTTYKTVNDTKTITFISMRVQPYFNSNTSNLQWGEPYYCVGFFTVPIWAGLFVTFCLLAITFYGIMMMMDIRTMDRFDDPKGKTITINALE